MNCAFSTSRLLLLANVRVCFYRNRVEKERFPFFHDSIKLGKRVVRIRFSKAQLKKYRYPRLFLYLVHETSRDNGSIEMDLNGVK